MCNMYITLTTGARPFLSWALSHTRQLCVLFPCILDISPPPRKDVQVKTMQKNRGLVGVSTLSFGVLSHNLKCEMKNPHLVDFS